MPRAARSLFRLVRAAGQATPDDWPGLHALGKVMTDVTLLQQNEADVESSGKLQLHVGRARTFVRGLFSLGKTRGLLLTFSLFCVFTALSTYRRIPDLDLGRLAALAGSSWGSERAAPAREPVLVLFWDKASQVSGATPFRGCPVSNCRRTTNHSLLADAEAVIFHGHSLKLDELPAARRPGQQFVFFLGESPPHLRAEVRKLDDFFTLTMSYHREADVLHEYGRTEPGRAGATAPFENRTRPVAWAVSNCHAKSGRNEYVKELSKHIDIDVYGNCNDLKTLSSRELPLSHCPPRKTGPYNCYPIMAQDHFFYLAFENSRCRDYITEKFWASLVKGMVPVVLGPSKEQYGRVAPPDSFLHVADFISPAHLARRLKKLMSSRDEFERLLAWRDRYHVSFSRSFCDLCALLQAPQQPSPVNISHRWSVEEQCEPALS